MHSGVTTLHGCGEKFKIYSVKEYLEIKPFEKYQLMAFRKRQK